MQHKKVLVTSFLIPLLSIVVLVLAVHEVQTALAEASSELEQPVAADDTTSGSLVSPEIRAMEVVTGADLRIVKISQPHNVVLAGKQFTYTILVDNLGPSTATNIVVTDTLVTEGFIDANGCSLSVRTNGGLIDEFNCNFALSTGVFDLATMGSNWLNPRSTTDMGRIIITINATADEDTDLTNVATVTSDTYDPDMSNNIAIDTISVQAVADLAVTKTAVGEIQAPEQEGDVFDITDPGPFPLAPQYTTDPNLVTAGRRVAYTLTVTNNGPSSAKNVLLVDNLPEGVTIIPGRLSVSQGSCNTGSPQITCGLGSMGNGIVATLSFHVYVDPSLDPGTVLTNDAFVLAETYDINNRNDFDSTMTTVNTWADMEITKNSVGQNVTGYDLSLREFEIEDLPGKVTPGMMLRYEITVQNTGPSDAQGVQILDLLPGQTSSGLTFDPVTFLYASGATCDPMDEQQEIGVFGPGGGLFGQVIWCDLGTIPVGGRETFHISVQTDPSIPDGLTLTNGAFVWWGPSSPLADPGSFLPFPFPQIPAELPTTDDPFPDDNFDDADTNANAVSDVWISKVDVPADDALDKDVEPDLAIAGDEHRYLITVGTDGPSDAQSVEVQDFLDFKNFGELGEHFLRCEPFDIDDFVSCSETNGVIDVDLLLVQNEQVLPGQLNAGEVVQFYVVTEVDQAYVLEANDFVATNDSRITTATTDFHTANNVDAHDTLIMAEADLSITKESEFVEKVFTTPEASGIMTYTITATNNGPSDAAQVNVVDYLPDGLVFDPAYIQVNVTAGSVVDVTYDGLVTVIVGNDPDYSGSAQLGRMNTGSTEVVTIVAYVRDDVESSTLVNNAMVVTRQDNATWPLAPDLLPGIGGGPRTPTTDPDLSNNVASIGDPLQDSADLTISKYMTPEFIDPGDVITYKLMITNTGPMQAEYVVVTDYLPTSVIYINSAISVPGVCLGITTLTCNVGHMNTGDVVTVTVDVKLDPDVPLDTVVKNDASVFSDDFDPNLVDNYASVSATAGFVLLDKDVFLPIILNP